MTLWDAASTGNVCNGQEGYGIQEMKCNRDKLKVLTM